MLQPLAIRDVPAGAYGSEDSHSWRALLDDLAEHGTGSLVVVLARPGTPDRTADDDAALRVLGRAADDAGLELRGRAIATPSGILTLGPPGAGELARPA
jgi:hypothetical protein